jgi:MFS family permease
MVFGADIAFFTFGLNISSSYTILPLFVHHLTNANWLVALIPALRTIGTYGPPLLVAGLVERRTYVKPFILFMTIFERIPFFILGIAVILLAHGFDVLLLILFYLLITMQATGGGLTFPAWLDLIARAIPENLRGRFLGGWSGVGNILGVGGAALATAIIVSIPWPWNYALCFFLSFGAVAISFGLLASGREPARLSVYAAPRTEGRARQRLHRWLRDMWTVVQTDRIFQPFLIANAINGLAGLGTGLLAVAALRQAHLSEATVSLESTIVLVATMVGNFLWGWVGDRFGHRMVLVCGALGGTVAMTLAIFAHQVVLVTLVFFTFGLGLSAVQLAQLAFVVEFGTPERRPTYIGLAFLLNTPFAALGPVLGGIIADRWGYTPVFVLATFVGACATLAYGLWVRDPKIVPVT